MRGLLGAGRWRLAQAGDVDGFAEVALHATGQAALALLCGGIGGGADHRYRVAVIAQLAGQRVAVHARHVDIGHHQIEALLTAPLQRFHAILCQLHVAAEGAQLLGQDHPVDRVVLDGQHTQAQRHRWCRTRGHRLRCTLVLHAGQRLADRGHAVQGHHQAAITGSDRLVTALDRSHHARARPGQRHPGFAIHQDRTVMVQQRRVAKQGLRVGAPATQPATGTVDQLAVAAAHQDRWFRQ